MVPAVHGVAEPSGPGVKLFRAARVIGVSNMTLPMKTALTSILAATLAGFASTAGGRAFDAATFLALAFAAGLIAWTISQYDRESTPLTIARPLRLPANPVNRHSGPQVGRLAA